MRFNRLILWFGFIELLRYYKKNYSGQKNRQNLALACSNNSSNID